MDDYTLWFIHRFILVGWLAMGQVPAPALSSIRFGGDDGGRPTSASPLPAPLSPQDVYGQNPMMWADVPDPDVIRVGNDFFLVSTTMHLMPGGPVMRSQDLVHWQTVGYLFDRLSDSSKYDMTGGTVYGKGQWATSLRHRDGQFYALFAPNDTPGGDTYIYTTANPAEGWTQYSRLPHFHDASLFFDDDGRAYVFHGSGRLTELSPDLKSVRKGGVDTLLFERDSEETGLLEGSRVVKHNGKYYLLMISWPREKPRRQLCFRADSITGPYEKRVILEDAYAGFPFVGQGTIVDDVQGRWFGVIFQDRGAVGRVLTLMPCRWIDGWPMLGDAQGKIPRLFKTTPMGVEFVGDEAQNAADGSPSVADWQENTHLMVSDEFASATLDRAWQWNHNPVDTAWSLADRPGFLRLKALPAPHLFLARNTLSQRMEGPCCTATVKLDLHRMAVGDRCGFSAFNGDAATLTVSRTRQGYLLTMSEDSVCLEGPDAVVSNVQSTVRQTVELRQPVVFLRIDGDFRLHRDVANLYYSTDGAAWRQIGTPFHMRYDYRRLFMGTRYALFNYAEKRGARSGERGTESAETLPRGYVDVDWFRCQRLAEPLP